MHTLNPVLKLIAFISIDLINLFPILNANLQFGLSISCDASIVTANNSQLTSDQ
jgi:hypothetical protein